MYVRPTLERYGTFREVTLSGTSNLTDPFTGQNTPGIGAGCNPTGIMNSAVVCRTVP